MTGGTAAYARHGTLSAGTVDTVTLSRAARSFTIHNLDSSNGLWVKLNPPMGTADPAAGATDCLYVGTSDKEDFHVPVLVTSVKLISAGASEYIVEAKFD